MCSVYVDTRDYVTEYEVVNDFLFRERSVKFVFVHFVNLALNYFSNLFYFNCPRCFEIYIIILAIDFQNRFSFSATFVPQPNNYSHLNFYRTLI